MIYSIEKRCILIQWIDHVEYIVSCIIKIIPRHYKINKRQHMTETVADTSSYIVNDVKYLPYKGQYSFLLLVGQVLELNPVKHCASVDPRIYVIVVDRKLTRLARFRSSR